MPATSVILLSFFVSAIVAIDFPEHNCPEYFTYGIEGNGSYIGVFTANKAGLNVLNFKAVFEWTKLSLPQVSGMMPFPNYKEAIAGINKGLRGQTFVRFININNVNKLPTLTKFYLNDELLCNAALKTFRKHSGLKISTRLSTQENIRRVGNTRPKMHPTLPLINPREFI
ncbi:uncharacterized protein LOC108030964 isoform X1 [Drosophila biarmipes]|uniref:uncharacterized protein LOC108030964 isoform X1 n=1 Tax=Drosophila biarmipes TaxID=125945 RepID=UPI001CDAFC55|nr:uncharacterized protein LOC108030964 isoform X1 [Drosophila biarmipes]